MLIMFIINVSANKYFHFNHWKQSSTYKADAYVTAATPRQLSSVLEIFSPHTTCLYLSK